MKYFSEIAFPLFALWALAFLIGIVVVWCMRQWTLRIGFVDRPDPNRKLHRGAISLGGGLSVLLACTVCYFVIRQAYDTQLLRPTKELLQAIEGDAAPLDTRQALLDSGDSQGAEQGEPAVANDHEKVERLLDMSSKRWRVLIVAAVLINFLGLLDDRLPLNGVTKLLLQVAVVAMLSSFWSSPGNVTIFGFTIGLGQISSTLLILWLLATINSVNLIDGADGVTGSFGAVAALAIAVVGLCNHNPDVAIMATVLSASLAAFLVFNRPRATIFLGDNGSMLVGVLLGAMSVMSVSSRGAPQDLWVPIAIMAVPLFDSFVALWRRRLTGRSIYAGDRGHLHHLLLARLSQAGRSPAWIIPIFAGLSAVTGIGAVVSNAVSSDLPALASITLLIGGLIGFKVFGHAELKLALSTVRRHLNRGDGTSQGAHVSIVALQGNRRWEVVWQPLVQFAESNGVSSLRLDLNMPWLHEGYHGTWNCRPLTEVKEQWMVRLPVICYGRVVGRLDVFGQADGNGQFRSIETLSFLVAELQPSIERLLERRETEGQTAVAVRPGSDVADDSDLRPQPPSGAKLKPEPALVTSD